MRAPANRSGRRVIAPPMTIPPALLPSPDSLVGLVYWLSIRYCAQAMKSSIECCFVCLYPPRCHSSPYSPPPRTWAIASTPPRSSHASQTGSKCGSSVNPYAPYPVRSVGRFRSNAMPRRRIIDNGTRVPSALFAFTSTDSYSDVGSDRGGWIPTSVRRWCGGSYRDHTGLVVHEVRCTIAPSSVGVTPTSDTDLLSSTGTACETPSNDTRRSRPPPPSSTRTYRPSRATAIS